jgi:Fe-S oxidoreductase
MDLCLSCKGCKSECPSNVDVAKLKAEFLQQYYDANGVPFRSKLIANFSASAKLGALMPGIFNFMMTNTLISNVIKSFVGFGLKRSMPTLYTTTLLKWYKSRKQPSINHQSKKVYLFCDEFTNFNDTAIGIKAILLLEKLGYEVIIPKHEESGRASLSKGLLRKAKIIANKNISIFSKIISAESPLIGIEPSAILTFRDEYLDLADDQNFEASKELAKNVFMIDEFIASEMEKGNILQSMFTNEPKLIQLHGHCQQKAISSVSPSVKMMSFPENYKVEVIPSGCCGMAGSFGYEKEHYDLSMKIGELVLLPTVRNQSDQVIIAAPGTSCRHQIKDGTGKKALHTVEVLYEALIF